MGLGAKLNLAFITVIAIMAFSYSGCALFNEYRKGTGEAERHLNACFAQLQDDFEQITLRNEALASSLTKDPRFLAAYSSQNRELAAKVIKEFIDKTGLAGFVAIIDGKGTLFYSTETPTKFGISVRSQGNVVDYVLLRNESFKGAANFTPTGIITVSSLVPLSMGSGAIGIVTINQPLSLDYLTGIATKFALGPEHIANIDIALFASNENKIVAVTPALISQDGGVLAKINEKGLKALPTSACLPPPQRLWKAFPLPTANNVILGTILLSAPLPDFIAQAQLIIGQAVASTVLALVAGFIFSTALSGSVYGPLRFLIQRARDLSAGKGTLPPLEGLTGQWLELGELLDTSMASMRSSVQSLRNQLAQHNQEIEEKLRTAETSGQQLNNVNRQLADKTRQLAEVSKQVNYANQQAVLLQHKLDSVLQISTEGYLILDQYGNVLSANPVFLNWMGVSEGEIAGQLCFDLVKKPGEPHIADLMPQAFARHGGNPADLITQFYPEGIVYHRYQDKTVEVLAHLQPVVSDDSNIQGYIMVLRDKSLRSEIAQLRTEIVAMLSDSIRAPLASAEPTWKTLLSSAARTMHPSVGQGLVELHNHYEQLLGLVDSLLMMYGGILPPPMIPREQVIITRLAADCLEEVAAQAREHQLTLDYKTVTGLPPVNIDKETIRRVTVQLLEKMIAITAPGGRVRVETLIKASEMRMGIYSSGPALPQEEIEDMFIGFMEGKHKEQTYGSRLSLYLARNNIERLGGRLWAESQEGRGTAIFFTISIA